MELDVDTEQYSSKPTLAHGHRLLVPWFIEVQLAHLMAKKAKNLPMRADRMQATAILRSTGEPSLQVPMYFQGYHHGSQNKNIQKNLSCCAWLESQNHLDSTRHMDCFYEVSHLFRFCFHISSPDWQFCSHSSSWIASSSLVQRRIRAFQTPGSEYCAAWCCKFYLSRAAIYSWYQNLYSPYI